MVTDNGQDSELGPGPTANPDSAPQLVAHSLLSDMRSRGLLAQCSDEDGLLEHLQGGSRTLYCGFDPTADSLHIGNLVPLLALRRFQLAGHRPIILVGGATGMIGDPSGKSAERNLTSAEVVADWTDRIRQQVSKFFDFNGQNGALVVNNYDWTVRLNVIDFLRDVGKHFSVNAMMARDSVKSRLDRDGEGISYTEFSYVVLQSMDFAELAREYGATLQVGGSDQWGNIVSGVDLIRRRFGSQAYAATFPLVTKADGTKFGKTAGGAIWLDAEKTSPYSFYQFWLNTADADVIPFLYQFTFLSDTAVAELADAVEHAPQTRAAQKALAGAITELVHGSTAVVAAERISQALFQGDLSQLTQPDLAQLALDGMDSTHIASSEPTLTDLLVSSGLAASKGAARKLVAGGGVKLNGVVQQQADSAALWDQALFGRYHLLRRGKKTWHMLVGPE